MDRKRVSGSQIRSVGYEPSSQTLEIEFASGSLVQYTRVSAEIHRRLMASPSPGSFFQDRIEDEFTARRIR
jgi:hypothetical protein